MISEKGKVFLVGAGPGDPNLATLRTREIILKCDVLVYDHLANPEFRKWASPDCEQIDVGKSPGRHTVAQEEIGKILVSKASDDLMVVRLKGGDPFVFGRCAEEMSVLDDAGIDYEIIPGVTAALACAAYAGIPLSHRDYGSSISFLTGHEDVTKESLRVDFTKFADVGGTLCIYMGMSKIEEIVTSLLQGGMPQDKPAAIVSNGTLPTQRHLRCNLGEIVQMSQSSDLKAPAIIFVGNAVGLSFRKSWFEDRPLFGRRIAITRSTSQNSNMKSKLEELGSEVLELPLIEILPTEDRTLVAEVFAGIATYEWVIFTSANGANLTNSQRSALMGYVGIIESNWEKTLAEAVFKYAGSVYKDLKKIKASPSPKLAPAQKALPSAHNTLARQSPSASNFSSTSAIWLIKAISKKLCGGRWISMVATRLSNVTPMSS